jgi:diguanylate cyclase (GGDEF)-like protein
MKFKELNRYIAELQAENRRLKDKANKDILTNLHNRRYAIKKLEEEWINYIEYNNPLSLFMLDLDHFKAINDTFGHDIGDKVLEHVARLLKESSRHRDTVCRLGGEEFLIIAPNTNKQAAKSLAERYRKSIEENQCEALQGKRIVTCSIGISCTNEEIQNYSELMKLADNALYFVKHNGRNGWKI